MVNLHNRNRILKPVNEQSHSSYGRLDISQPQKAGTAASGQSVLNRELAITENQIDKKGKLVKSSDRLDKVSRQVGSRGMP